MYSLLLLPLLLSPALCFPTPPPSVHLLSRADLVAGPTCNGGSLSSHNCNVALLGLGGGIAGTIEFLRVDATTDSSTSGGCTMTVTAVDGGTSIDISKGRLEQGQKAAIDACGQQAWSVTVAGGSVGGDLQIVQSAA
ncbi:hypothetical protein JCM24511_03361 [Saitozyma sp. JCM 24511]|nr:hypothetical protein JCM24511_03361 [Saitozyma sp. JCM 24511]